MSNFSYFIDSLTRSHLPHVRQELLRRGASIPISRDSEEKNRLSHQNGDSLSAALLLLLLDNLRMESPRVCSLTSVISDSLRPYGL